MRLLMLAEARNIHTRRWASALSDRGWEVTILSRSTASIPRVRVIPLRVPGFGVSYPHRWWKRYTEFLAHTVRDVDPHIVHIHYLQDHPIWWSDGEVESDARPALVISTWGSDLNTVGARIDEPPDSRQRKVDLLQAAEAVTSTTHYLARHTADYGGLDVQNITVIPFGVDMSRFCPMPRSQVGQARADFGASSDGGRPTVGFIKHLEPFYGPEYLLRAVPHVVARFPDVRFVIVGDGSMGDSLRRLAERLGIEGHLDWRGALPHEEIPGVLAEMDLLVMPSVSEAFGVSAVEAQACEVPVVAFDIEGVDEAIAGGVGGLLVSTMCHEQLASAICQLLGDRRQRIAMGRRGREFVRARFDMNQNVAAMETVYRRVVNVRASRSTGRELRCPA